MVTDYYDSTRELRKNWSHDTWIDAVSSCTGLFEVSDCPDFSAEEWKDFILQNPTHSHRSVLVWVRLYP